MKTLIHNFFGLLFLLFFGVFESTWAQTPPGPAGPISGPAQVCTQVSGISYSIDPVANATSYVWNVPAGFNIISGTGTNNITVDVTISATSGSISVYGVNAYGNGSPSYLMVTVNSRPVPIIAGLTQVCSGTSGIIYVTDPGMTGYIWTISAGGVINSGAGTSTVLVTWLASGAQNISVTYTHPNGCSALVPTIKNVTVNTSPVPTITGSSTVCAGTTGAVYSTEAGMTGYSWNVSSGGVITAGGGTNTITVTWNTSGSQTVSVNYISGSGCGAASPTILPVTVLPFSLPSISGSNTACAGASGVTYTTEAGMTGYNWTISSGGTITSGLGTNTVTVTWNNPGSQSVSVNYTSANGCSASSPTVKNVTVYPIAVPSITGNGSVCAGHSGTPYTTEPGMTNYSWNVSSGGTIISGTGTNSILVVWSTPGPQNVSVLYSSPTGCTAMVPTIKNVTVNPSPLPTITGTNSLCAGTTGFTYTTESGMTGYVWSVTGGTITAGSGTKTITVTWTTPGSQTVSVNYTGSNGCTAPSPTIFPVIVYPVPAPSITGNATSCVGTTGLTYATEGGIIGYTWTISAVGTITSGMGTSIVTVTWNNSGSQTISVNYTTPSGCTASNPTIKNVTVYSLPVPMITGSSGVCAGVTGITYSTEPGMTGYTWNVSSGGIINSGSGTYSIKVTWNTPGPQTVSVFYFTSTGCPAASVAVKNVTVNSIPSPTISGITSVCSGATGITYSTEPGMTGYLWNISSGGTITSGAGTSTITVTWTSPGSKTVTVNYITPTGCSAPVPTIIAVTVNPLPVPVITGPATSCSGTTGITYSTEAGMTGYIWTISSGGTITSGSGTNIISVSWNTPGSNTVSVNYTNPNGCTAPAATVKNITVYSLPVPVISGNANV